MMLTEIKNGERIVLRDLNGNPIEIMLLEKSGTAARLSIKAPEQVQIELPDTQKVRKRK